MRRLINTLLVGAAVVAFSQTAQAADLLLGESMPGIVDAGGNWDGFHIGAFVGGAAGLADHSNAVPPSPCATLPGPLDGCDVEIAGLLAGLTAGANFYLSDDFIVGIAADVAWSNVSGSDRFLIFGTPYDSSNVIDWQGSLRGVIGFDAGVIMPYVTGGLAFAHATHELTPGVAGPPTFTGAATHVGWTAGGGVAVAIADNVSLDFQYRYSDFGAAVYDMGLAPFNPEFHLTQHAATVGLNYRF